MTKLKNSIADPTITIKANNLKPCRGEEMLIQTIFSNLISNSIKYRKQGEDCFIEIGSHDTFRHSVYYITDNGIGMDTDVQEKAFQYFYRSREVTDTQGSGLGLSITKWACIKLGGEIWVDSTKDVGTTFYVSLPKIY